jgi:hypothetical protein
MACGCENNFGGESSLRTDNRPKLKNKVRQSNWRGSSAEAGGNAPTPIVLSYSNMKGRGMKSKPTKHTPSSIKKRFNSFMGRKPQVNLKKHNIPMEEYASYTNRYANFNPFEHNANKLGFGANGNSINRKDFNVEF